MSADAVKPLENDAIVATGLTKWIGEGDNKMTAVDGIGLVAHFTKRGCAG